MSGRRLVIFDCDGTLVDTIEDVALSFNAALAECGFPEVPFEAYGGLIGGNLEQVVARLLPEGQASPEAIDRVKECYRRIYASSEKPNTLPYEGVPSALEALQASGCVLAVNTNKGQALAEGVIDALFPEGTFAAVVGYEEPRPSKPDPAGVRLICEQLGFEPCQALYVGDGAADVATAANAGIPCVLVQWGQGAPELAEDPRVAAVAAAPGDLPALIASL